MTIFSDQSIFFVHVTFTKIVSNDHGVTKNIRSRAGYAAAKLVGNVCDVIKVKLVGKNVCDVTKVK